MLYFWGTICLVRDSEKCPWKCKYFQGHIFVNVPLLACGHRWYFSGAERSVSPEDLPLACWRPRFVLGGGKMNRQWR